VAVAGISIATGNHFFTDKPHDGAYRRRRVENVGGFGAGRVASRGKSMRSTLKIIGAALLFAASGGLAAAQTTTVSHPSSAAVSPNLSDLPPAHGASQDLKIVPPAVPLRPRASGPGGADSGDRHLQGQPGPDVGVKPTGNFPGITANGYIPPDPNIAVSKTDPVTGGFIVQLVNSEIAVFDKTGKVLTGPVALSSLWSTLGGNCATNNAGDPIVQYDVIADRWLVTQLGSTSGPTYSECIAVSQTNDPRGAYSMYSYSFGNNLNDYPKFAVWPTATNSAYFASYNLFANGSSLAGAALCAYDRAAMLSGASSPAQICSTVSGDSGFLPADLDGATPPSDGTPGYFLNFETLSSLRLYQMSPNFAASPPSATLTEVTPDIAVPTFSEACGGGTCIPQPNSEKLDSLGDRLMYRLAYRVFSDHAAMVVNHSIVAGASVGVRWYELRQSAAASSQCGSFASGAFYLCQSGTFAPDSSYRWMGSAAMDGAGDIALGYSLSSSGIYPSIAFTSRTPGTPSGMMGAETIMQAGAGAQTTYSRWGDYTALRIDPTDDTTFWYTNEYYSRNSPLFNYVWSTAIGSFTVGSSSTTADFSLSASPTSLTVSRGSSGKTTVTVTALSGSSSVNLSVSGLPKGTNASFNTNPVAVSSITPSGTSTLTISPSHKATTGTFTLTITGSSGSTSHNTSVSLTIH
jgi:hypothetical protein